jgi:hypothetical protein
MLRCSGEGRGLKKEGQGKGAKRKAIEEKRGLGMNEVE